MSTGIFTAGPSHGLTLPLLRRLRWTAVLGQTAAVIVTVGYFRIPLPLGAVGFCLAVTILTNLWLHRRPAGPGERPEQLASVLALDVALLTILLFLTGGPHNPFTSFYLVHVALAAVALPLKSALLISAECCLGYATLFRELAEDAQLIAEEVQRCRLILNRLANPAGDPPEVLSMGEVLKEVGSRFERAPLVIGAAPATARLVAPRQALIQALSSLIKNSLDASPAGSSVHLTTCWNDPVVEFQVVDRGGGLSSEVSQHAGEPFYTTKPPGQGVGLGLFLVRLLAQRLGGDFTLRSQTEGGARAILRLPRVPPGVCA